MKQRFSALSRIEDLLDGSGGGDALVVFVKNAEQRLRWRRRIGGAFLFRNGGPAAEVMEERTERALVVAIDVFVGRR